jgi:hypothetical protein
LQDPNRILTDTCSDPSLDGRMRTHLTNPRTFLRIAALFWVLSAVLGTMHATGTHVHGELQDWTDPPRWIEHLVLGPVYLLLSFASDRVVRIALWAFAIWGTLITVAINVVAPLVGEQVVFHPEHELGHVVIATWAWALVLRGRRQAPSALSAS